MNNENNPMTGLLLLPFLVSLQAWHTAHAASMGAFAEARITLTMESTTCRTGLDQNAAVCVLSVPPETGPLNGATVTPGANFVGEIFDETYSLVYADPPGGGGASTGCVAILPGWSWTSDTFLWVRATDEYWPDLELQGEYEAVIVEPSTLVMDPVNGSCSATFSYSGSYEPNPGAFGDYTAAEVTTGISIASDASGTLFAVSSVNSNDPATSVSGTFTVTANDTLNLATSATAWMERIKQFDIPDGNYSMGINPTPTINGIPDFGSDGSWNSALTLGCLPAGDGCTSYAMSDNGALVNGPDGSPRGSSVAGDAWAGSLEVAFRGNSLVVRNFHVDTIAGTSAGDLAQNGGTDLMQGVADGFSGALSLVPSGRLATTSAPNIGDMRFNVEDGATGWTALTTAAASTPLGGINGTPVSAIGDVNNDGKPDFTATLVSAGVTGADWGPLAGTPYYESWNTTLLSQPDTFAEIGVQLASSAPAVNTGETLTLTAQVSNNGPHDASGVTVDWQSLKGALLSSSDPGCTASNTGLRCVAGNIAAGENTTIQINVTPSANGPDQVAASVFSFDQDTDSSNNEDRVDYRVAGDADLGVTISADRSEAFQGDIITYTLTAHNGGPDTAYDVQIVDELPNGLSLVSVDSALCSGDPVITCQWGALSGSAAPVTLRVRADASGVYTNSVAISGFDNDPDPSNNSDSVDTAVLFGTDLSVQITDSPDPVVKGAKLAYAITVSNEGGIAANNVALITTLPDNIVFETVTSSQGECTPVNATGGKIQPRTVTGVNCALGLLEPGTAANVTVVIKPLATGVITGTVSVSADEQDSDLANNEAEASTNVNK